MTAHTLTLHPGDILTVTVPAATTPPNPPIEPPVSPPAAGEAPATMDINTFNRKAFAMQYPSGANADLPATGPFGQSDVVVCSFTTPAVSDGRTKIFNPVEKGAGSFACTRLMTIASQPQIGGGIISANLVSAMYGQSPSMQFKIGGTPAPYDSAKFLQPNKTYYVTLVNRKPDGTVSITPPNTGEMTIHFNN